MGGQVLIRGPQEKTGALLWCAAQAAPRRGQFRGVVVDLQDLNRQGPCGRAGWGGCKQERPGGPLPLQSPHPPLKSARWSTRSQPLGSSRGPSQGQGALEPRPSSTLTIISGQDDGPVPAVLEEGGCGAEHALGLDPASGPVHLQPVFRVIVLGVAVGEEGRRGPEPEPDPRRCGHV